MMASCSSPRKLGYLSVCWLLLSGAGCATHDPAILDSVPHEMAQLPLPPYIIECRTCSSSTPCG